MQAVAIPAMKRSVRVSTQDFFYDAPARSRASAKPSDAAARPVRRLLQESLLALGLVLPYLVG